MTDPNSIQAIVEAINQNAYKLAEIDRDIWLVVFVLFLIYVATLSCKKEPKK